jgi:hypothetical protein
MISTPRRSPRSFIAKYPRYDSAAIITTINYDNKANEDMSCSIYSLWPASGICTFRPNQPFGFGRHCPECEGESSPRASAVCRGALSRVRSIVEAGADRAVFNSTTTALRACPSRSRLRSAIARLISPRTAPMPPHPF